MPPRLLPGHLPMGPRLQRRRWLALAGLLLADWSAAQTSNYPTRPIRLLVGDVAGSPADQIARALGPLLQAQLGQPVRAENLPGKAGALAAQAVVDAAGDGHTWLLTAASAAARPAPYSWADADLMPIALVCQLPAAAQDGGPAGSSAQVRLGLMGPGNMHAGVAMRVHAAVQLALATAELQGRLAAVGAQALPAPRQAFVSLLLAEQARPNNPKD